MDNLKLPYCLRNWSNSNETAREIRKIIPLVVFSFCTLSFPTSTMAIHLLPFGTKIFSSLPFKLNSTDEPSQLTKAGSMDLGSNTFDAENWATKDLNKNSNLVISIKIYFNKPWTPPVHSQEGYLRVRFCRYGKCVNIPTMDGTLDKPILVSPLPSLDNSATYRIHLPELYTIANSALELADHDSMLRTLRSGAFEFEILFKNRLGVLESAKKYIITKEGINGNKFALDVPEITDYPSLHRSSKPVFLKNGLRDSAEMNIKLGVHTERSVFIQSELGEKFSQISLRDIESQFETLTEKLKDMIIPSKIQYKKLYKSISHFQYLVNQTYYSNKDQTPSYNSPWPSQWFLNPSYIDSINYKFSLSGDELEVIFAKSLIRIVEEKLNSLPDRRYMTDWGWLQQLDQAAKDLKFSLYRLCSDYMQYLKDFREYGLGKDDHFLMRNIFFALSDSTPVSYLADDGHLFSELLIKQMDECFEVK